MTEPTNGGAAEDETSPIAADAMEAAAESPPAHDERKHSTTVGTGSYVALSCTVLALLVTFVILGVLFLLRWLS